MSSIIRLPMVAQELGICAVCRANTKLEFLDPELGTEEAPGKFGRCCFDAVLFADFVLTRLTNFQRPQN